MVLTRNFGWLQIVRLGLVQACLGAVVVVTTSTFNRVMVVELTLPELLPGILLALHYLVQMIRPRMGFGSDQGHRNTPWMMIFGFAVTTVVVGKLLVPYTPERLVAVATGLAITVVCLATASLWGLKSSTQKIPGLTHQQPLRTKGNFKTTLVEVWSERQARLFTIFVFLSMLAYRAQDLILGPFAGTGFNLSPGETTQLAGFQHGAVLIGILWIALVGYGPVKGRLGSSQSWMVWVCLLSAAATNGLTMAGIQGSGWPLRANIGLLGVANWAFSIAAGHHDATVDQRRKGS